MVNHWFDEDRNRTRCRDYEGVMAEAISANDAVSCPECFDGLSPDERVGQRYGDDAEEMSQEGSISIAYRDLGKAINELNSEDPDMGHVFMYVNSAMIWLRGWVK